VYPVVEGHGQTLSGGYGGHHQDEESGEEERVMKYGCQIGGDAVLLNKPRTMEEELEKERVAVHLGNLEKQRGHERENKRNE
jgi:hypothetical protein